MTGPGHYRIAQALLEKAAELPAIDPVAVAQVHATLALAAATALGMAGPDVVSTDEYEAWEQAAATLPAVTRAEAGRIQVAEFWQPRVDELHDLVRDMLDAYPAMLAEYRDRAGGLNVHDTNGQPYATPGPAEAGEASDREAIDAQTLHDSPGSDL